MKDKVKILVLALTISFTGFNSPVLIAKTIKIATLSPEGTFWMKQMRAGAKEIKDKTNGRVKFKYYPGGVMGNDENVLRKIRIGQLQGGAVTLGVVSQSTPDVTLYGLPYLFSSLDDAAEIRKTTDPMLRKEIEKNGFVNFGFAQGGFTYLMSKKPIRSLDDLRQRKSWIPEKSDIGLSVYRYIGIAPISLPMSDVLTGLQTGLIDTITTSPIGALALQWHTHIKYVTDEPLNYLAAMMIIDRKVFEKLSETDQKIIRNVMGKVYKKIDDQNKVDNIAVRKALINQGVKFIRLSKKDKEEWEKIGNSVINEMLDKYKYNKALYEAVTAHKQDAPKYH
ncbi:MAG: TRAP transporter substrate-binding protein [Gammaproteobacteria bacterium]|nr:MAG: TRAP transporter substrate-binding protein [Gammaproteobacteria bacterium]